MRTNTLFRILLLITVGFVLTGISCRQWWPPLSRALPWRRGTIFDLARRRRPECSSAGFEVTSAPLRRRRSLASAARRTPRVAVAEASRAEVKWSDHAMVLWQGALPEGEMAKALLEYADTGGMVVCFPGQLESEAKFAGIGWGPVKSTQNEQGRAYPSWREMVAAQGEGDHLGPRVVSWEEGEGPLARTEEGYSLPMDGLYFSQRRSIEGGGIILASIARDSNPERTAEPLIVRKVRGRSPTAT